MNFVVAGRNKGTLRRLVRHISLDVTPGRVHAQRAVFVPHVSSATPLRGDMYPRRSKGWKRACIA